MATPVQVLGDDLVREYLISRGYASAAAALETEAAGASGASSTGVAVAAAASASALATPTVDPKETKAIDGAQYLREFKELTQWVSASLDIVKPYLQSVNFAVFVNCYVRLVHLNRVDHANALMLQFRDRLLDCFVEELHFLALLQDPAQLNRTDFLNQNIYLKCVVEYKFSVTMSSLGLSLLATFLDQHHLVLMASLINEKIAVNEVSDDFQRHDLFDINTLIALPGYTHVPNRAATNSKIALGVPGSGKALAAAQAISPIFHGIQQVDKSDGLVRMWLDRLVRPKALLRPQMKKARVSNEGMRSMSLTSTMESLRAAEKEEPGADPAEPSVMFSTIGNSHDNLISMHINRTVTQVATGYADSVVRVWRLDQAQNPGNPPFGQSLSATAYSWAMNEVLPATKQALTERALDAAREALLDQSAKAIRGFADVKFPCLELKGHSQPVYSVCQDSTDRLIASSSADQTIRLWDTALLQSVCRYECLSVPWDVKFHPLDYYLASANQDRSVMLYSTDRLFPMRVMVGHTSDVNTLAWHGNGLLLASGSDDKTVRLWDIRKADCVRALRGCNSAVSCVAVSPLGNLLAAAGDAGNIYLYELMTSKLLAVLHGHTGAVHSLSFSADGLHVISGGSDCSVRIWSTVSAFSGDGGTAPTLLMPTDSSAGGKLVLKPRHSFFTKASPVYYVGYTAKNMAFAGGPCQAASREDGMVWSSQMAAAVKSEQDAAALLRLTSALPSNP